LVCKRKDYKAVYGKITVNVITQRNSDERAVSDESARLQSDERWQLVHRIAASVTFSGSPPLQAFLLYITEKSLLGKADEVKEQTIGSQVLRRKPDFDPTSDNIVRVQARQLRQRLERYFATEGSSESLVVSIPKGAYVPIFAPAARPSPRNELELTTIAPPAPHASGLLPWVTAGILAAVCALLLVQNVRRGSAASDETRPPESRQLWAQMFPRSGSEVTVILADSGFALWQDLTLRTLSLADYLGSNYLEDPQARAFEQVARRRYTSLSDVNFAVRIQPVSRAFGSRATVRFARNLDINELKSNNVILLGSRRANPWVELFESHLHYVWRYDNSGRRSFFESRFAKRGSQPHTLSLSGSGTTRESYAIVALLPNMTNNRKVMLIEGLSMEGTDAAGDFLLGPDTSALLARKVNSVIGSVSQPFEALLKLTPVAGGSANTELVSVMRPLP
jgi:hypothetical protein